MSRRLAYLKRQLDEAYATRNRSIEQVHHLRKQVALIERRQLLRKERQGRTSLQRPARAIYQAAFNQAMPKGTKVWHFDRPGPGRRGGDCTPHLKRIRLYRAAWNDELTTLVHEFIHLRLPDLRHGAEFNRLVEAAVARVWAAAQSPVEARSQVTNSPQRIQQPPAIEANQAE